MLLKKFFKIDYLTTNEIEILNTTYKIIVQNTYTTLKDTGIQYSVTIFENQEKYLP